MSPDEHYAQRLRQCESEAARIGRTDARLGAVRLGVGAAFLGTVWLRFGPLSAGAYWMLLPAGLFAATVWYHTLVRRRRAQAHRASQWYRAALDRVHDRWHGSGTSGARFDDPAHVYGSDLDLFGPGGLYPLMCAARTSVGEACLAAWMLAPADPDTLRLRHLCVADLRDRPAFREDLAASGRSQRVELDTAALSHWVGAPNRLDRPWIRIAAPLLAVLAATAAVVWAITGFAFPLLGVLLVELPVAYALRVSIEEAFAAVENGHEGLKGLADLVKRIESSKFDAPPLQALAARLSSRSRSASDALSRLSTIVNWVESRRNPLLAPLLLMMMYPLQAALAAERWRAAHGAAVSSWLAVVGEFEALDSLARYAFEHPHHPFPEFLSGEAAFVASSLGHPLIPSAVRVCNDVDLSGRTRLLLVSGSNMSGKSTLLRTVGINTVLAMMGAPVHAARLALTPLQVGASIRVNDSLHEGSSRFYAEITRLRRLFEPSRWPRLFLLDELLQGTNSADRKIGAQGIARALVERGAIGLISTHDLALADIPGLGEGVLVNVHFQDELRDGRLAFDFKLQPGVVSKSNGIELMRSIGLEV